MDNSKRILLNRIREIRAENNILWMKLVELALSVAEEDALVILRSINENDRKIGECMVKLGRPEHTVPIAGGYYNEDRGP